MKKTDGRVTENAVFGWINAAQFVAGLKAAGPDFTQQKVVDAVNAMTDFNADGLLPPVDWTTAHENDQDCMALLKIVKGKFKPVYGKPGKPVLCFADDLTKVPKTPEIK